jgi:putative ABC transport system permease protein
MSAVPGALKIAFRSLAKRKFFTFVSLFGIAFTLLVLLVAAAFLDQVIGPHPPESRARRTLYLTSTRMAGEHSIRTSSAGYGFLDKAIRGLPGAEAVSFSTSPDTAVSYVDGRKVKSRIKYVDGAFWTILDMRVLEGSLFSEEDNVQARPIAVINATTRDRLFGGATAVGKTIDVAGTTLRVVGVVEDVSLLRPMSSSDIYAPIGTFPGDAWRGEAQGHFRALILARSRADLPALIAEVRSRVKQFPIPDPKNYTTFDAPADTMFGVTARDILSDTSSDPERLGLSASGKMAMILIAAALLFMTLPAINLVNVNLSRVIERASEIGVRRAFGATRSRLVGQFIVENVALTLLGGAIGAILAAVILTAITATGVIPHADLTVNFRVLAFGLVATLVFGLLSGVVPAWRMSRLHPVEALRGRAS